MLNCTQIADVIAGFTDYDLRQHPRTRNPTSRTFRAIYTAAASHFNYSYTEMALGLNNNTKHTVFIQAMRYYKEIENDSFMWPLGLMKNSTLVRDVVETEPEYAKVSYDFSDYYNTKSLLELRGVVGDTTPAARLIKWAADKIIEQEQIISSFQVDK